MAELVLYYRRFTLSLHNNLILMRVLIINTSETNGGAAVAANRLMEALQRNGVKAKMLVAEKQTNHVTVSQLPHHWLYKWHFLRERLSIFRHLYFSKNHLFEIDTASAGSDITSLPEFREADIIHLNWINQGMLSLGSIRKIVKSGKPIVWTMHDLWPATGICHYARSCGAFRTVCHHCKLLPGGGSTNDLSRKVWKRKKALYHDSNIHFVTCSRWLEAQAKQSALLSGEKVVSIPNTIDTHIFCPKDRAAARLQMGLPEKGRIVLFVSQKVTNERKGAAYFIEAINRLADANPEFKTETAVAILGASADEIAQQLHIPSFPLGYISDAQQIASVYNAADVYVLPSLEDNLPNTIMESMACGVPSVGFRVGGIPEMIDHKRNGYVANFKDAADLAEGIRWTLYEADPKELTANCLHKVAMSYSQQSVAMKYIEVYNEMIAMKRYII